MPKRLATEYGYLDLKPFQHNSKDVIDSIATKALRPPLRTFLCNTRRVKRLIEMPANIAVSAAHFEFSRTVQAKPGVPDGMLADVLNQFFAIKTQLDPTFAHSRKNAEFLLGKVLALTDGSTVATAIDAMLDTVAINVWTACEVFMGDLWERALNCHPMPLARLDASKANSADARSKSVDLEAIAEHGFNIKRKMGTILRKRADFKKLAQARDAYKQAFASKDVHDAMADPSLDDLSQLRHVIVHSRGIVDEDFRNKCRSGHLKALPLNRRLQLTGRIVSDTAGGAVSAMLKLVHEVDKLIVRGRVEQEGKKNETNKTKNRPQPPA